MTAYHRGLSPLLLCAALTAVAVAQGTPDNPELKILSPGADAYVSGPTLLRAKVDPPDGVTALTFFVNGRQACALTKLPFECEWDAGPAIADGEWQRDADQEGERRLDHVVEDSAGPFHVLLLRGDEVPETGAGQRLGHCRRPKLLREQQEHDETAIGIDGTEPHRRRRRRCGGYRRCQLIRFLGQSAHGGILVINPETRLYIE